MKKSGQNRSSPPGLKFHDSKYHIDKPTCIWQLMTLDLWKLIIVKYVSELQHFMATQGQDSILAY